MSVAYVMATKRGWSLRCLSRLLAPQQRASEDAASVRVGLLSEGQCTCFRSCIRSSLLLRYTNVSTYVCIDLCNV